MPMEQQHLDALDAMHQQAQAQYAATTKAMTNISSFKNALDGLLKKGDVVTAEDVIQSCGDLVGKGQSPQQLAGLLADMPEGGQAIQGWLQQHDQFLGQQLAQVSAAHVKAQHQLGVSALHALAGHGLGGAAGVEGRSSGSTPQPNPITAPSPQPSNPLTGG